MECEAGETSHPLTAEGLFGEARLRPDDDVDLRENTSAESLKLQPEAGEKRK